MRSQEKNINILETVEGQDKIIKLQSEIIYDLFTVLLQHISAEEADALPVVDKINRAAVLKEGILLD